MGAKSLKDGEILLQECVHAISILESKKPRLIDFKAHTCISLVEQTRAVLSNKKDITNEVCINIEETFLPEPQDDIKLFKEETVNRIRVVVDFLKNNPDYPDWTKENLVYAAYINAFSCMQ